jgi:outer membrane protein assembly factor BamB
MFALRPLACAVLAAGLLLVLDAPTSGQRPVIPPPSARPDDPAALNEFILPTDPRFGTILDAIDDCIKAELWDEATSALGKVLDHPRGDVMVIRRTPRVTRMVNARATAYQVLAGLPKAGRDAYEMNRGQMANALLKDAARNEEKLAEIIRRFPFTSAGGEALEALGALHFDRGRFSEAAHCYELLHEQLPLDKWPDGAVYRATLALHRAGAKKAQEVEKVLRGRIGQMGLKLGERNLTAKDLDKELADQPEKKDPRAWPIFGGSPPRTEPGTGSAPHLTPRFKTPTVREEASRAILKQAATMADARSWPAISGATPLVVNIPAGNKADLHVLYRSWWGVHAISAANGTVAWEAPTKGSLDRMIRDVRLSNVVRVWAGTYLQQNFRPTILWENSQAGSLSATDQHVFVIDDLCLPPPPVNRAAGLPDPNVQGAAIKDMVEGNLLQGYQLRSGKLSWEVGGPNDKGDLKQSYFLGPPLPLDGRLYALNEKNQDLRLVTLEPATGKMLGIQSLGSLVTPFNDTPLRRIQAVHLSSSGGILVIPTSAGAVLGYDLLQGRLAWAHAYREPPGPVAPPNPIRWPPFGMQPPPLSPAVPLLGNTAPYIAAGKVVFQPAEGRTVYCIDLRDGSLVWKQALREDDLYVGGVTKDLVLVVGKRSCRALNLNQGQMLWALDTGLPSGQGQVVDGTYYLPLKESAQNKDPEVCAIDLARGRVISHIRGGNKDVPGNLLFQDGFVVSQTPTELSVFPQLAAVIEEIDARLKQNPNDPQGLLTRGELKLDKGDLKGAIEDLRKARDNKPDDALLKRIRTRLYEALTDLLQRDFAAGEQYLKEYEDLLEDKDRTPEGQQQERRRRAQFYMLTARGLAQLGKPVEALEQAIRLATLGADELLPSIDEPGLRVSGPVWAREFVAGLLARSEPGPRKQLDEALAGRWKRIEKGKDPAELRGFIQLLGVGTAESREAHLLLAELRGKEKAFREADVLLQKVRARKDDPERAARALAALAALATEQALLPDAVHYARQLKELYPNTPIGDGKKGADVLDAMSTDKRFLPFLEDKPFPAVKLKATEEMGNFPFQPPGYRFQQVGEALPFFTRNAVVFRTDANQFRVVDAQTGEERWSAMLGQTLLQQILPQIQSVEAARARATLALRAIGHLVVLPAGNVVFGIDPVAKKVLWQVSLNSPFAQQAAFQAVNSVSIDPRDGTVNLLYPDGWSQTVGRVLPATADAVVLQTREGLLAVDPLTGSVLWHRTGLGTRLRTFGDEEHLAVVELNLDGTPTATHLLRLADGGRVKTADFAGLYGNRLRELGCTLLVGSALPNGGQLLRQYDVRTGKDLWRQETPAGTLLLDGDDPALVGWIEPGGKVRVLHLPEQKKVLEANVEAKALEKVLSARLVLERDNVYLLTSRPPEAGRIIGVPGPAAFPQAGFRSAAVNGDVFAFERATGQLRWFVPIENQNLLLLRLDESPLLLFTTRYTETQAAGMVRIRQVTSVQAVNKRTGKLLYDRADLTPGTSFFDFRVDPKEGVVELIGTNLKVRFAAE